MMTMKLQFRYLSPEPDRHGNDRLYVRRNGRRIRIREQPGTAAFAKAYAAALDALAMPEPERRTQRPGLQTGTFGWLAERYFASDEFRSLDPESQSTRRRVIEACLNEPHSDDDPEPMRNCPLQFLSSKKIKRLRDLKAKEGKPGAANNRRKYLSAMFGWAIEAEHMKSNPARDVRRKKYATNGFYTWTLADVQQYAKAHPIGTKAMLAMALLLFLGVRRSDMVGLGPSNIITNALPDGTVERTVRFVPRKTRYKRLVESEKPILPILWGIIESSPRGTETFLETDFGKPFSRKGIGNWMRERCDEAGLPQCTAHGLRKIGATLCAELGATDHQMMSIFDWTTPQQAAVYTRAASRKRLAAGSMHLLAAGASHLFGAVLPAPISGELH